MWRRSQNGPRAGTAGQAVTNDAALSAMIMTYKPGDRVTVTVVRGGATLTLQATLGVRPSMF